VLPLGLNVSVRAGIPRVKSHLRHTKTSGMHSIIFKPLLQLTQNTLLINFGMYYKVESDYQVRVNAVSLSYIHV